MLSKEEIEKFIQEMTEVRPDKLNKEALRLYNTIMQILDKNEQLETENKELKANNQKLIEKLEEEMKKNEWSLKRYDCTISDYKQSQAIGAWNVLQKIKQEIAKGEK